MDCLLSNWDWGYVTTQILYIKTVCHSGQPFCNIFAVDSVTPIFLKLLHVWLIPGSSCTKKKEYEIIYFGENKEL